MTDEMVLNKITEVIDGKKPPFNEKNVSIDTIVLALNIKLADLLLHLNSLEANGKIEISDNNPKSKNKISVTKRLITLVQPG